MLVLVKAKVIDITCFSIHWNTQRVEEGIQHEGPSTAILKRMVLNSLKSMGFFEV